MLEGWEFPNATLYLVGILGLLVVWQYYQMQIMAGRILAVDIFDRSGIRMYIYVTPDDDHICEVCAHASGRVFLPSQVAKPKFSPLTGKCQRPAPCVGVLVGLYGAWLEARGVLERLRRNIKKGGIQLSAEEVRALVNGQWERCISAETDRLGVQMIEALSYEKINQAIAITGYQYVVQEAKEVRHLLLLVPAYFRLMQLLLRAEEEAEALELIELFESRFPPTKRGPHFPSDLQRDIMKSKKVHLTKGLSLKMPA
jgi:xanthosine utilization system XapX-like protein